MGLQMKTGCGSRRSKALHISPGEKGLLALVIFMAWWNLMINGPLELAIPHLLARTGSDRLMSLLLGAMNAGALGGALFVIGGFTFRKRPIPMFAGSLLTAAMFLLFGLR